MRIAARHSLDSWPQLCPLQAEAIPGPGAMRCSLPAVLTASEPGSRAADEVTLATEAIAMAIRQQLHPTSAASRPENLFGGCGERLPVAFILLKHHRGRPAPQVRIQATFLPVSVGTPPIPADR